MSPSLPAYKVLTTKEARADLRELRAFLERQSDRRTAAEYIARLKHHVKGLALAPVRGSAIAHFTPGLRRLGFERRVGIIFAVFEQDGIVEIQGFDYAGRQRW